MLLTQNDTLADIYFSLKWERNGVIFRDSYFAHEVNFLAGLFPGTYPK